MRREELYLRDIVEAADHITRFLGSGAASELSAVVQKLAMTGEAAARISKSMKMRYPEDCHKPGSEVAPAGAGDPGSRIPYQFVNEPSWPR